MARGAVDHLAGAETLAQEPVVEAEEDVGDKARDRVAGGAWGVEDHVLGGFGGGPGRGFVAGQEGGCFGVAEPVF